MASPKLSEEKLRARGKCDFSRATRGNQDDPRCAACNLETGRRHEPVWRENQHAAWQVCQLCHYRLQYVPKHGETGLHRAAGPLPADVTASAGLPPQERPSSWKTTKAPTASPTRARPRKAHAAKKGPETASGQPAASSKRRSMGRRMES